MPDGSSGGNTHTVFVARRPSESMKSYTIRMDSRSAASVSSVMQKPPRYGCGAQRSSAFDTASPARHQDARVPAQAGHAFADGVQYTERRQQRVGNALASKQHWTHVDICEARLRKQRAHLVALKEPVVNVRFDPCRLLNGPVPRTIRVWEIDRHSPAGAQDAVHLPHRNVGTRTKPHGGEAEHSVK